MGFRRTFRGLNPLFRSTKGLKSRPVEDGGVGACFHQAAGPDCLRLVQSTSGETGRKNNFAYAYENLMEGCTWNE